MNGPVKKPKAEVRPIVLLVRKNGEDREYEFKQDSIVIGSGRTAHLILEDESVSSIHAVIKLTLEAATIMDLGSDTKTFVNGHQVSERVLKDGDLIKVGLAQLAVQLPPVPFRAESRRPIPAGFEMKSKRRGEMIDKTVPQSRPDSHPAPADDSEDDSDEVGTNTAAIDSNVLGGTEPTQIQRQQQIVPPPSQASPERLSVTPVRKEAPKDSVLKPTKKRILPAEPTDVLSPSPGVLPQLNGKLEGITYDRAGIPQAILGSRGPSLDKKGKRLALQVSLYWGEDLVETKYFAKPGDIVVGENTDCDFRISDERLGSAFTLIRFDRQGVVVALPDHTECELACIGPHGKELVPRGQLKERGELSVGASANGHALDFHRLEVPNRLAIELGPLTLLIQYVRPITPVVSSLAQRLDHGFMGTLIFVGLFTIFAVVMVALSPPSEESAQDDLFKNAARFAKLVLNDKKAEKKKFELAGAKAGAKRHDDDGRFAKPPPKPKDASASVRGAPHLDPNKREKDRKVALNAGILGALKGGKSDAVSNVFGPGGLGSGINTALGGLRGASVGDAGGLAGLGSRGAGPGGGGNSLGIGGIGSGAGQGANGAGNVDLGGRGKSEHGVEHGKTVIEGALSQEAIARVLSRAQSQMRYCYEKELQRIPDLYGKITVKFEIANTGLVSDASIALTTMNNQNVEDCLVRVFSRLRFPQPAGGGEVQVSYPLIYKPTGGE